MPSQASLEQVRRLLNRISTAAAGDLRKMWGSLSTGDRLIASQILTDGWLALVDRYGSMASEFGAAQFDDWAVELGIKPRLTVARGVDEPRATARLNWALSTPDQIGNALVLLDELVKQPFRSTVQKSAAKSGGAWARVPTGRETCSFCTMLASRGAVYHSPQKAGRDHKYHGVCDCVPTLVRDEGDYPKGYDPTALYDLYSTARANTGSGQPKAILAEMRQMTGAH